MKWNRDNIYFISISINGLSLTHSLPFPIPKCHSLCNLRHLRPFPRRCRRRPPPLPSFRWISLFLSFYIYDNPIMILVTDSILQIFPHQRKLGFSAGLFTPSILISHSPTSLPLTSASSGFSSSIDTGFFLSLPPFPVIFSSTTYCFFYLRMFLFSGLTSELDAVSSFSQIVPDTVVFDDFERYNINPLITFLSFVLNLAGCACLE